MQAPSSSSEQDPVRQALQQAEAAYREAQTQLADVAALPSARLPYRVCVVWSCQHNAVQRSVAAEGCSAPAQLLSLPADRQGALQMPPLLKRVLKAALTLGAVTAVIASHAAGPTPRWVAAALAASYIGVSGYHKQRLSTSGALWAKMQVTGSWLSTYAEVRLQVDVLATQGCRK